MLTHCIMLLNKSYSVLLAFLLLTVTLSTAQNTAIDSLKRVIVAAKIDTAKANACNAIANAFKEIDPDSWVALDACSLHGSATADGLHVKVDLASCTTLAPGIGASVALLPIDIHHDGERLDVRLYADQARGPDAKVEARRVRWFEGWAALHGGGRSGDASSKDWHMNRELRLGSEGGRVALKWRDGQPSGYSLMLERATYRDGNVPVLKLSVLDDATGSTISYAWSNPEAERIGISLGWIQVGLSLSANQATP